MTRAIPESADTGTSIPTNIVAGSTVRMAVTKRAAIWVRAKAEIIVP